IDIIGAKVFINNKPDSIRILLERYWVSQSYRFVRDKACFRVNLSALQHLVHHVVLCPGNEVGIIEMKVLVERVKLHISLIHQIVSIRLHRYLVHNVRIMNKAVSKIYECRDRASKVQQGVHLKSAFSVMKSCPRAE